MSLVEAAWSPGFVVTDVAVLPAVAVDVPPEVAAAAAELALAPIFADTISTCKLNGFGCTASTDTTMRSRLSKGTVRSTLDDSAS
jgi:hypothetical protein